jgi:hypothetical protein
MSKSKKNHKKKNYIRRTKKNIKGGSKETEIEKDKEKGKEDREGIVDLVEEKVGDLVEDAGDYLAEKGLRLLGLQAINKKEDKEDEQENKKVDNTINKSVETISKSASGVLNDAKEIGSDVVDVFNKGSAAVIGNINDVLESPKIEDGVQQAASETSEIAEGLLENFNEQFNSPEMKKETEKALDNIADVAEVTIKAMDKPIDEAIDKINNASTKAASGAISGVIKVGTDAMAAVPYVGAVMELGKMLNDGSKAVSAVVDAGSEAVETGADLYLETSEKIKSGIKELEKKKKEGEKIIDRTQQSIHAFEKPIKHISSIPGAAKVPTGGGKKTKKKFFKNKGKSKKVRFVL